MNQWMNWLEGGNTVIVAENDMRLIVRSDWIIDLGPSAGAKGGRVVAEGMPDIVANSKSLATAPFLAIYD